MRANRGFTLVELMVVVTILAVLATIAIVSYKYYIRRARLEEGRELLMDVKMKQEQYFSTYSQYVSTGADGDFYPESTDKDGEDKFTWMNMDCKAPANAKEQGWCDLGFKPTSNSYFQMFTVGWNRAVGNAAPSSSYAVVGTLNTNMRWYYGVARAEFDGRRYEFVMTSQLNTVIDIETKVGP